MESILSTVIVQPNADMLLILEICFVVSLFLYIPFLCLSIGSLVLSLWYGRCGAKEVPGSHEFAREMLFKVLPERHYGFVYGVMPVLTILVVYAQSLYEAKIHVVGFFLASVFFAILGFHFLYKYRWSLRFRYFLSSVQGGLPESRPEIKDLHGGYEGTNGYVRVVSGGLALFFLLLSMYQLTGAMNTVLYPKYWDSTVSSFYFLGNVGFWIKYSLMLCCCFAVSGAGILYFLLKGNDDLSEDAYCLAKSCGSLIGLYATLCIPVFGLLYVCSLPLSAYSMGVTCCALTSLFFLFLTCARLSSMAQSTDRRSGSSMAFFLLVIALGLVSVGDNVARENATSEHTQKILTQGPSSGGGEHH
ncbi:hypothetical protein HOF92_06615 [bacterium]|nr:hypothetical protein [bacterium]